MIYIIHTHILTASPQSPKRFCNAETTEKAGKADKECREKIRF